MATSSRILFLEVLNEFSHKLLKQDKKVILNFLDRRISSLLSNRSEECQPLSLYRNSLLHGETDHAPVSTKRAYVRKRRGDHGKLMQAISNLRILKYFMF